MQQLDCGRRGIRQHGLVLAAGLRNRQSQSGTQSRATRKYRMANRGGQFRWRVFGLRALYRSFQGSLNSVACVQDALPQKS